MNLHVGKHSVNIIIDRLDLVNVGRVAVFEGEAKFPGNRPGPEDFGVGPQLHEAVEGVGGQVLGEVESLVASVFFSVSRGGKGITAGAKKGCFDGEGGEFEDDGSWPSGGRVVGFDAEGLGDAVGEGRDRGDEGFFFGRGQDGLEDAVGGEFGGDLARVSTGLVLGGGEAEDTHGEGTVVLLHIVQLVLKLEDLRVGIFHVGLTGVEPHVDRLDLGEA